jgi:hypothetical protein
VKNSLTLEVAPFLTQFFIHAHPNFIMLTVAFSHQPNVLRVHPETMMVFRGQGPLILSRRRPNEAPHRHNHLPSQ